MPVIQVDMLPGRTAEQKRELIEVFTREFVRICKTSPEAVKIVIRDIPPESFGSGGVPLSEQAGR
ncbi:MAG: tautomerase family protein [Bacillota bacterium]